MRAQPRTLPLRVSPHEARLLLILLERAPDTITTPQQVDQLRRRLIEIATANN